MPHREPNKGLIRKSFRSTLFVADPEKVCRSALERAVLLAE